MTNPVETVENTSAPKAKTKVVIVDDDESTREILKVFYSQSGYAVEAFACPVVALAAPETQACDLIICDLRMPKMDGVEFVAAINKTERRPPVILLTAHESVESAVEGLEKGAFDYITKPINFNEIAVVSDRAIKLRRMEEAFRAAKRELAGAWRLDDIRGKCPQMQRVFGFIRKVAQVGCNVLITGESGTGKEMVARAIHSQGPRAKKPFAAINCAAIPDALLESELFGHTKGSFTGATERRRGLLEDANEGTIFLDEIGDMPLPLQAKLLRFLQDRTVKSVGENTYRKLDVRVIAATHQNLEQSVAEKTFRADLFFRLCVAQIVLPALRDRTEDIPLLAEHFRAKITEGTPSRVAGFTRAGLAKLMRHKWPGNVRELENVVERAVLFCDGTLIDERDIELTELAVRSPSTEEMFGKLMTLEELEREYIAYVLKHTGNMRERAAEILGVNRKTLYRKQLAYSGGAKLPHARSAESAAEKPAALA